MNRKRLLLLLFTLLAAAALLVPQMMAQSATTGDVTGTVTDPSGAVIAGATVTLKSNATATTQTATTNDKGFYRFSFLAPGNYSVTVAASGFQSVTRPVSVVLGKVNDVDFKMSVTTATQTVEVSGEAPLLQTEEANVATNFNEQQVKLVPNPGNDLSFVAQSAPGTVMNTQSGFGNFSSFGLPGTSNLFTLDGMNDNDPFLNLNNSGATNLLLGQNEIAEATVTNNGYSGQFGQLAGSTVSYVTKSGTNRWHGNAIWWWNGRVMNANDWFNNHTGTPRPFDNANQYAASLGGPIKKDKLWFFVDYEGLRVLLPTSDSVTIPTPAFQTQILNTLAANGMTAPTVNYYNTMFGLWNTANGVAGAVPSPFNATVVQDPNAAPGVGILTGNNGGCGGFYSNNIAQGGLTAPQNANGFGNFGDPTQAVPLPCTETFRSTAGNFTHEWLLGTRVDWQVNSNNKVFFRVQHDVGSQATYTDPVNPVFDAVSIQPEWQGQTSWTHIFGSGAVNSFVASAQWYSAIFKPLDLGAALSAFPTTLLLGDGTIGDSSNGIALGGLDFIWPQGRNVTQYQFVDDYSKTWGNHTLKFGANYHRNDVSDFDFGFFQSGLQIPFGLDSFVNGGTDPFSGDISILEQSFPQSLNEPMAVWGLGLYAQDEWRVRPNLTLTLSLRMEHNSNPVCQHNCFANLNAPFTSVALDPTGSVPYNQTIRTGLHQALQGYNNLVWSPRVGFAWSPVSKTVVRGGVGYFYDLFPATVVDNFSQNPPLDTTFVSFCNNLAPGETAANGCGTAGNLFNDASTANSAFQAGFLAGLNEAAIAAAVGPAWTSPNFSTADNPVKTPQYLEWNLAIQRELWRNAALTLNYVGNHGIHEAVVNNGLNAFCPGGCFIGLPAAAPDARFTTVSQVQTIGISNYNGLVISYQQRFTGGQIQFNYTYSHALDEISNGGFLPFNDGTNASPLNPQDPFNLRKYNYGNADYDVRHYVSMNYYYELPFQRFFHSAGWAQKLYRGWVISGTVFHRTGLPFTVLNTDPTNTLSSFGYGAQIFANPLGPAVACGGSAVTQPDGSPSTTPCLTPAGFTGGFQNFFGNQTRNQYRGPGFFDTDFTIMKNTGISRHWEAAQLGVGLQFFNLFNHPNFDQPVSDLNSTFFGSIQRTVNTPTSILGSFLGGDASPRLIQFTIRLQF